MAIRKLLISLKALRNSC